MRVVLRVRRASSRLGRFVGVSVGAHAVAAAVLLALPFLRPKADLIPQDATFVELSGAVTAPAASAPAPPPPRAPEPQPAPEPEGPVAVEKVPEPSKKKVVKEDPKRQPEPRPATPGPPGPAGPVPPRGAVGPPGPAGITSLEPVDPGLAWYNAAVAGALENAWVKPLLEGVEGIQSVVVAFQIGRDGNVFNLAIDAPSGIASLDRSAIRAVQDAAPFPPPPPAAGGGSVRQRIRFDLRPDGR